MIKIGIVDDKMVTRKIILDKLSKDDRFLVTLQAVDGADFISQLKDLKPEDLPQVVLMDLEMPNVDGITAVAVGSFHYPQINFVMLTIYDDDEKIFNAIKAGAIGYLLKDESAKGITEMLWQMQENNAGAISPGIAFKILQMVQNDTIQNKPWKKNNSDPLFQLTERELEILRLLVKGDSYREIGDILYISPNTAKKHIVNIYRKLHINSKAEAIRIAYEKNLLEK